LNNDDLILKLKMLLATDFSFYMKAHNYHVNVRCKSFAEYHQFLGEIYQETWEAADTIAELIRTLDSFSPFSYTRFSELSRISDELTVPDVVTMFNTLIADNATLLDMLYVARQSADVAGNFGITNVLEDLISATQKRHWMLKSFNM
jgi:starvation-inducible DNA-binding protein